LAAAHGSGIGVVRPILCFAAVGRGRIRVCLRKHQRRNERFVPVGTRSGEALLVVGDENDCGDCKRKGC
jgi:hypothetical protein